LPAAPGLPAIWNSVDFQGQPNHPMIFSSRNWNRFWNREPKIPGTVGDFGEKLPMKSMVGVTGFEPATYTSRT
jgi:hypothetical protein